MLTRSAFLHGLRELGYVEGQNMTIEWRWGHESTERFSDFAAEIATIEKLAKALGLEGCWNEVC